MRESTRKSLIAILDAVAEAIDKALLPWLGFRLWGLGKTGVRVTEVLAGLLFAFLTGSFIQSLLVRLRSIDFSPLKAHPYAAAGGLMFVAFLVGTGLSIWKSSHQLSYGLGEILFGMVMSFSALFSALINTGSRAELFSKMLALISAIYIISRGVNNASESAARLQAVPVT
jgi:hypothetical protein